MYRAILLLTAIALSGCAMLSGQRAALMPVADAPEVIATSDVQKPVRLMRVSRPIGLVPCESSSMHERNCWRSGDRHFLNENAFPSSEEGNALVEAQPVAAKPRGR